MKKKNIIIETFEYSSADELSAKEKNLIQASKNAVKNAYAPYSEFQVAAAVLLENGEIVTGTNQENAAYPSGLCAERVAVFYANSKFPDVPVKAIAISAFTKGSFVKAPIPPCGSCRQVLLETESRFKQAIKIYLIGEAGITVINDAKKLLPLHFNSISLEAN